MLLEPLERVQVQVVGRLVQQQELGVGDHQACQRCPGLLTARQGGRRLGPLVAGEPEAAQRRVDALVQGVSAQELVFVLEIGIGSLGDAALALERGQAFRHQVQVRRPRPDGGPQVR